MRNLFKIKTFAILTIIALFSLASCSDDDTTTTNPTPTADNTIAAKAVATADLSILVAALTKTNLVYF